MIRAPARCSQVGGPHAQLDVVKKIGRLWSIATSKLHAVTRYNRRLDNNVPQSPRSAPYIPATSASCEHILPLFGSPKTVIMVQTSTIVTASVATAAAAIVGTYDGLPPQDPSSRITPATSGFPCGIANATSSLRRVGYAVFFDVRRRSQADFRRTLRRNERRQARAEKEEAAESTRRQRDAIKIRVDEAKDEGFPAGVEEREAYFNEQVMSGEMLSSDRMESPPPPLKTVMMLRRY